jgi:hypothetical protein
MVVALYDVLGQIVKELVDIALLLPSPGHHPLKEIDPGSRERQPDGDQRRKDPPQRDPRGAQSRQLAVASQPTCRQARAHGGGDGERPHQNRRDIKEKYPSHVAYGPLVLEHLVEQGIQSIAHQHEQEGEEPDQERNDQLREKRFIGQAHRSSQKGRLVHTSLAYLPEARDARVL